MLYTFWNVACGMVCVFSHNGYFVEHCSYFRAGPKCFTQCPLTCHCTNEFRQLRNCQFSCAVHSTWFQESQFSERFSELDQACFLNRAFSITKGHPIRQRLVFEEAWQHQYVQTVDTTTHINMMISPLPVVFLTLVFLARMGEFCLY